MQTHPQYVFKHCLRCGSAAVSYKSDAALLCAGCGFCYYVNAAAAVAVLISNKRGELLLTQRALAPQKGKLDLPGGFVNMGESAEDAVSREVKEELSIDVEKIEYIGSYPNTYVYSGLSISTLDMAFVVTCPDFVGITARDDVSAYDFYPLDRICLDTIAFDSIRQILKDFMTKREKKNYNK